MQKEKPTKVYSSQNSKKRGKGNIFHKISKSLKYVIRKAKDGSVQHIAILVAMAVLTFAVIGGTVWGITKIVGGNDNDINEIEIDPDADNKYDKNASLLDEDKYSSTILQKTEDAGKDYIDETLFVGDSNTVRSLMYDVTGTTWENIVGAVGLGIQHIASTPEACVTFTQPKEPVDILTAIKWIQPKRVVFSFGTNNANWKTETFIEEYKKAIEAAHKVYPYFDVIVNAVPPVDRIRDYPNITMQQIDAFNAALAQMCEEEGYKFLNSAEVLKDETTGFAKKDYTIGDGIHLSKNGFTALFDYIRTHAYETEDRRPELTYCPKRNEIAMPSIIEDPIAIRGGLKVIFTSNDYELGSIDGESEQYVKYTKTSDAVKAVAKTENGGIFTGWSCEYGGISDPKAETITFTAPQLSEEITTVTITANFKRGNVNISQNSMTLKVGQKAALSAHADGGSAITWSTSDSKIAAVDGSGSVTAVAPGIAKITASTANGKMSASCTVTVVEAEPEAGTLQSISIKAAGDVKEIKVGEGVDLSIVTNPQDAVLGTVSWTSSDPNIAQIAANGAKNRVVGLNEGIARITASVNDGKLKAVYDIKVSNGNTQLNSVILNPVTVEEGKTAKLVYSYAPADAIIMYKSFSISDPLIASISQDGTITTHKAGNAVITVTINGITGTTTLTVTAAIPTPTPTPESTPEPTPELTPTPPAPTQTPPPEPEPTPELMPTPPTPTPPTEPMPETTSEPIAPPTESETPTEGEQVVNG